MSCPTNVRVSHSHHTLTSDQVLSISFYCTFAKLYSTTAPSCYDLSSISLLELLSLKVFSSYRSVIYLHLSPSLPDLAISTVQTIIPTLFRSLSQCKSTFFNAQLNTPSTDLHIPSKTFLLFSSIFPIFLFHHPNYHLNHQHC